MFFPTYRFGSRNDSTGWASTMPSLKLTASLPPKKGLPKKGKWYSNHPFVGAIYVSFRDGIPLWKGEWDWDLILRGIPIRRTQTTGGDPKPPRKTISRTLWKGPLDQHTQMSDIGHVVSALWVDEIWAPQNWGAKISSFEESDKGFQAPGFGEHRKSFFYKKTVASRFHRLLQEGDQAFRRRIAVTWQSLLNKTSQELTISADADPQRGWLCCGLCRDSWGFAPNRSDG